MLHALAHKGAVSSLLGGIRSTSKDGYLFSPIF